MPRLQILVPAGSGDRSRPDPGTEQPENFRIREQYDRQSGGLHGEVRTGFSRAYQRVAPSHPSNEVTRMNWSLLNRLPVSVLAMVALTSPAAAADPKSDGLAALQKQDFKQAYDLLLGAVEDAKNKKDDKETADLLFY